MDKAKTFIVAGATGRQGGANARHLLKAGKRVVGITHSASEVQRLESMGVVPLVADTPEMSQPMPALLHLYLEDVDAICERVIKAGAISLRKPEDQPYGDRMAGFKDKWGNQWWIATHIKDLTVEEMQRSIEESRDKKK